jgi:hypothetical protein
MAEEMRETTMLKEGSCMVTVETGGAGHEAQ